MYDERHARYYTRLLRRWQTTLVEVSIAEIADAMACTPRYARSLIQEMSTLGWLSWEGRSGRGAKGYLQCKIIEIDLSPDKGFQTSPTALAVSEPDLENTISTVEGQILVPFYRILMPLIPSEHTSQAERHLISMIHAGLTRWDAALGKPVPDLAHTIIPANNYRTWVFHLRTGLIWQNGMPATSEQLVDSLSAHIVRPGLQHIQRVELVGAHELVLHLSRSDAVLPWRLSNPIYALSMPGGEEIGLGPFLVDMHTKRRVRLVRFPYYHGYAPLINQIDYVITAQRPHRWTETVLTLSGQTADKQLPVQYEPDAWAGFVFLAFNERLGRLSSAQQSLIRILIHNAAELEDPVRCALHLPEGLRIKTLPIDRGGDVILPAILKVAYVYTPETERVLHHLQQSLRYRHCRLELQPIDPANWFKPASWEEADFGISDLQMGKNWWFFPEIRFRHGVMIRTFMPESIWIRVENFFNKAAKNVSVYPKNVCRLMQFMLDHYWLMPVFTFRFKVLAHPQIRGVQVTPQGWPDYRTLWVSDKNMENNL